MDITCPQCGFQHVVNTGGRKKYNVDLTMVYRALVATKRKDGRPHYEKAAEKLLKMDKNLVKISGAFVHVRITREAAARGIDRSVLLEEILRGKSNGSQKAEISA